MLKPAETGRNQAQANPSESTAGPVQSQTSTVSPNLQAPAGETSIHPRARELLAAFRKQIPEALLYYEPKPTRAIFGNPVVNEHGAAGLLGVSQELLKKWQQRSLGPNYIQYGKNGPIRYELTLLSGLT